MSSASCSPLSSYSNYDHKIREESKRKVIRRKQKEKKHCRINYDVNVKKRKPRNVKVIRATPISPNVHHTTHNAQPARRQHHESKEKNAIMYNAHNTAINLNPKTYEYGNQSVLLWMKKQRKIRAQQQKQFEKKKKTETKKRKDYILNLNKNQRNRARKVLQRKRAQATKKNIKQLPKPQMIFDAEDEDNYKDNNKSVTEAATAIIAANVNTNINTNIKNTNDNDKALLLSIYNGIQQNESKRKIKKKKKLKVSNKHKNNRKQSKNKLATHTNASSVEQRLNTLKETSTKLQKRLENIAQTLHFPNHKTVTNQNRNGTANENESVITLNPHFIEPIECQNEIDKINCVFHELQKEIECDYPQNNVLNIYANEEEPSPEEEAEDEDANSNTNKLLLELELLQNVEDTAFKLERFEAENEKWFSFEKQKCELNTFLHEIKTEIEYIQTKKKENEKMTEKQMELIKNTGTQITKLIKETQTIQNQDQKRNLELIQLSTNILTSHQNQNSKEKEELQQTLKMAIELIDKYSQSQNIQNIQNVRNKHDAKIQTEIDEIKSINMANDDVTRESQSEDAEIYINTETDVDEIKSINESKSEDAGICDENNDKNNSELISSTLISEIVTDLFKDTTKLFELRQNRASILSRQHEIETSIKESMGIFADNKVLISRDNAYIASYVTHLFKEDSRISHSLCDQSKEQQTFNDLILDTLNEVVMEMEMKLQNKTKQTEKQIISKVQQKISKIVVCSTKKELEEYFVDDQVIDNRITLISNEWIRDFESSYQWITAFDTFKDSMKFQIADMIFEQFIEDIVNDINQIERHRQ